MKISESYLRKIIQEEVQSLLTESETVWYHCTSEENARKILQNGWDGGRLRNIQFGEHHMKFLRFLRRNALKNNRERYRELEKMLPKDLIGPKWRKFKEELAKEWHKHYSNYDHIWVSDVPLRGFGNVCLKVRLPDSAVNLAEDPQNGFLFMTKDNLGPERFERANEN